MAKRSSRKPKLDPPWLAYTDLLSSSLLILSVVVVASALARLTNEKPPVIRLSDAKDYRFARGSFKVNQKFRTKLLAEELPKIDRAIQCYAIDTIEIVGHTDNAPNNGMSNIDKFARPEELAKEFKSVYVGSNADLGLLRAFSVQRLLQSTIGSKYPALQFKSYSASSFIKPERTSKLNSNSDQEKRRIEIRLTRSTNKTVINKC